ncbi:MAG: methyltransferase domain-containing protein [Candidatus Limnocylindrales bacterium]
MDRHGTEHELDPSLRTRLKPSWRVMCDPVAVATPPNDEALGDRARAAERTVAEARALAVTVAGVELSGRILEIGCYDGGVAFQLARRPGTDVVGSDLARYYVASRPGEHTDSEIDAQHAVLAGIRDRARAVSDPSGGQIVGTVEFVEDDITVSRLDPASFDAIVSFEVFEHVQDVPAAFESIYRLLKPGGIAYNDYNPFFSANGGHSLCTLDFAWGHARLDDADFERYLREIRPTEVDQALRFYREGLNRLSVADLERAVQDSGLELLAVLPWTDRKLVPQLTEEVLAGVVRTYPRVTAMDLLATFVVVIARRPPTVSGQAPTARASPS